MSPDPRPPARPDGRGFQRLSPEARASVSRLGGQRRQALGYPFRFREGDERAREAGRRSGVTRAKKRDERLERERSSVLAPTLAPASTELVP